MGIKTLYETHCDGYGCDAIDMHDSEPAPIVVSVDEDSTLLYLCKDCLEYLRRKVGLDGGGDSAEGTASKGEGTASKEGTPNSKINKAQRKALRLLLLADLRTSAIRAALGYSSSYTLKVLHDLEARDMVTQRKQDHEGILWGITGMGRRQV